MTKGADGDGLVVTPTLLTVLALRLRALASR
jgi:hypothetical protein